MSKFTFSKQFIFFLMLLISGPAFSQKDRPTERQINTQKVFIEANREKLLGKYENAAVLYKEVLKRDRKNDAAAYELARLYDVLDKPEKALQSIQMAIELDKDNEWYLLFLADMYSRVNQFKKAAGIYGDLSERFPNNDFYYNKQAFALIQAKESEKAIKVYDKMEKVFGIAEDIVLKKYKIYMGIGNTKKAEAELTKLSKAYPYSPEVQHHLANFYMNTNKKDKAIKVYKQILKLNPDDAEANIVLAGSSNESGDELAYLNSLKSIFENPEVEIDAKVRELFPLIKKMETSEDEALKTKTLELGELLCKAHPNDAKSYSVYGDLLYHADKTAEAITVYEKATGLKNTVFSVYEQLLYIYAGQNDMTKLLSFSEEAMDMFPNKAKAYYFFGVANSQKENYMEAINAFEQARVMSGRNLVLQYDVLSRLGLTYAELKKTDKANKMLVKAGKLNPAKPTYYFQFAQGWLSYKKGDYTAAREWFDKSMKNGGDADPDVLEGYGDLLFQLDEVEQAIEYWGKAKTKGSNASGLDKKIADRKL